MGVYRMKKLLVLPMLLLFVGCDSPFDKIDENNMQIKELQAKVDKIDYIDIKVQKLETDINNIKEEIKNQKEAKQNVNEIIQKLALLNEEVNKLKKTSKTNHFDYIVIHPMTLITTTKTNIYNKPSKTAKVVNTYQKATTFTTYKEKNGFVKVTGYFVNNKWVENNKEWWIPKENTTVKRLEK